MKTEKRKMNDVTNEDIKDRANIDNKTKPIHDAKQRKRQKTIAMKNGEWDRCMFKIIRKNRYCSHHRFQNSLYCGAHLPDNEAALTQRSQRHKNIDKTRIPCPIDNAHTIYHFDLNRHVKICNRQKNLEAMKSLPCYSENINSGTHAGPPKRHQLTDDMNEEESNTANHSTPSNKEILSSLDQLNEDQFKNLCKRIKQAYMELVGNSIPLEKLHHDCCNELLAEKKATKASDDLLRHIEQQSSILGHLDALKLLHDSSSIFIELGSGRGNLSLALSQAQGFKNAMFILIDRAGNRKKADHLIAKQQRINENENENVQVVRKKIDIRHLKINAMKELQDKSNENKKIIYMSKHLCGVATDLSLRAIVNAQFSSISPSLNFAGVAIALCCHHACTWEDYVAPEYFLSLGFTSEEFPLLTRLSSWGTSGILEDTTETSQDTIINKTNNRYGLAKEDRISLGRQCKRLLDIGRLKYLKETLQVHAKLVYYCDEKDSLENCLLLAVSTSSP